MKIQAYNFISYLNLIHFEAIFVCGVREESSFIILLVDIQLLQHYFWKRLFSPLNCLGTLVQKFLFLFNMSLSEHFLTFQHKMLHFHFVLLHALALESAVSPRSSDSFSANVIQKLRSGFQSWSLLLGGCSYMTLSVERTRGCVTL